jgi:hypothetical protein
MALGKKDPMGWEYPYIVRLPEYILKLSGLYAISDGIDQLVRANEKNKKTFITTFPIKASDMVRAYDKVMEHQEHFKKLIRLRKTLVGQFKPKSHEQCVYNIVEVLRTMPNCMANYSQWFALQTVCSSETTFQKYKMTALITGKVREVERKEITDPKEIKRLCLDKSNAVKIFKAL